MEAAIKATEGAQSSLSDPRSGTHPKLSLSWSRYLGAFVEPISVSNVLVLLSDNRTLTAGLRYSSKKVPFSDCVKDYLGLLSSSDNPTPAGRAGAFVSLGGSKVQVEFEIISRRLRKRVLESMAQEKHGPEGVRIIRLLLETGKMDEKQVSSRDGNNRWPLPDMRPMVDIESSHDGIEGCPTTFSRSRSRFVGQHSGGTKKR